MNRNCVVVCLVASMSMAFACGTTVVEPASGTGGVATTSGKTTSTVVPTSTLGSGGAPAACPSGLIYLNTQITDLVGKPCAIPGEVCSNYSGICGGCSVTCTDGAWAPSGPQLCYPVGGTC
jgi:hypothetical protein